MVNVEKRALKCSKMVFRISAEKHEGETVKCPNTDCKNKIDKSEQKKVDSNFYFCKECGTVVYRRDKK